MRILHVINIYFSLSYLGDQFSHFSKKGYKQHLICSPSEKLENYSKSQNISFAEVEIIRKVSLFKDLKGLVRICAYIHQNKIDIVVGHTPKGALLAMLAAYIMRVPKRIYFRHGLVYETMHGFPRKLMMNIDRLTAFCATQIVCVSPSLAKISLLDHLNSDKKQLVLGKGTCSGIDAIGKFNPILIDKIKLNQLRTLYNIDKNTFVIGYCGRLVRDKGIIDLVRGFKSLQAKLPLMHFQLLLVGDFEDRDTLPADIITEIKFCSDIICTGFVFEEIEYYYSLMSVLVLPSYREGFGMVSLEAAAMELPVLTTKVTGCIDSIIEGETGFYISNTPEGITSGILKLMNDTKLKHYGLNGRKMVLEFYQNIITWQLIESKLYKRDNN